MPRDIKHTNISEKNVTEIQSQIRMFESVFMPLLRTRLNDKLMVYESQIVTLDHKVSDQPIRPSIYIYIYIATCHQCALILLETSALYKYYLLTYLLIKEIVSQHPVIYSNGFWA